MPQKEARCLRFSPVVVIYAECLLILQYIYGFDLTNDELPDSLPGSGYRLDEIGLVKYQYPIIPLAIKVTILRMFNSLCCFQFLVITSQLLCLLNVYAVIVIRSLSVT